jgi:hypothetical protein
MLKVLPLNDVERMEAEDAARMRIFAATFSMGVPIVRALRQAGFDRPTKALGLKLLANPLVQAELERNLETLRNALFQQKETILAQLDEDRSYAYDTENAAAAVAATVAKAKILGLMDKPGDNNMPKKITVEWGSESQETIYEKSNPLIYQALETTVGKDNG